MPKKENAPIIEITNELVINMIHEIRGQKVMLDFELAELYGYETKTLNQQVKNNIERFPKDFMFKLTSNEVKSILRSKILTTNRLSKKTRSLPYVFTEQGVYMLSTVLKGEIAVQQSIMLMRVLKSLRLYYVNSTSLPLNSILDIQQQVFENTNAIEELKSDSIKKIEHKLDRHAKQLAVVMKSFDDPKTFKQTLILDNQRIEADLAYSKIYSSGKETVVIVDNYISLKTLQLLKSCNNGVSITIYSDNISKEKVEDYMVEDFIKDTGLSLTILPTNNRFHDRFIMIDKKTIYQCGSSSKDSGNRITSITKINNIYEYLELLK